MDFLLNTLYMGLKLIKKLFDFGQIVQKLFIHRLVVKNL